MYNRGYATDSIAEESEGGDDDAMQTSPMHAAREGGRGGLKKQVELDRQGQSFWTMKEVLCSDIKKYAKDLDSTTGWEGHPRSDRKRLLRRLYAGDYSLLLAI